MRLLGCCTLVAAAGCCCEQPPPHQPNGVFVSSEDQKSSPKRGGALPTMHAHGHGAPARSTRTGVSAFTIQHVALGRPLLFLLVAAAVAVLDPTERAPKSFRFQPTPPGHTDLEPQREYRVLKF